MALAYVIVHAGAECRTHAGLMSLRFVRQVNSAAVPTLADKKAKTANKRKGAHQPTFTKLLADCEALLGHYLMSTITGDPPTCI